MTQYATRMSDGLKVRANFEFKGCVIPGFDAHGNRYEAWTVWWRVELPEPRIVTLQTSGVERQFELKYHEQYEQVPRNFHEPDEARAILREQMLSAMREIGYETTDEIIDLHEWRLGPVL